MMKFFSQFSIKNKTYLLVLLSVVVAVVLSYVSDRGLDTIRAELDDLVFATKIERYTNRLILEEQSYRLNANGSVYDLEAANQAYKNALVYVDEIYAILNTIDSLGESDLLLVGLKKARKSTNEYKSLYLKSVSILTELNKQADVLAQEGQYITLQMQQYVEAKRVEIKKHLNKKTIEKINNGSNIWQYTYVTQLHDKKYRLSPDESVFNEFKKDYQFMMSEWHRLKLMSDKAFEFEKLDKFYASAKKYESAMLLWVELNRQLVREILPEMKQRGNLVIANAIQAAEHSVQHMSDKRNTIAMTMLIVTVITILLGLLFGSFIASSISTVLDSFQSGLLDFFKYLNYEKDKIQLIKVEGKDEIAVMAKVVNKNIEKIQYVIERKMDYQQALLEWSKVDYQDDSLTINKATELSAKALHVEFVSIWLFDDDRTCLNCVDLYSTLSHQHESGAVMSIALYPEYFKAINKAEVMVMDDARNDPRSHELMEGHLLPLDIYSILDLPIIQEGKLIGIICHEKVGEKKRWEIDEQEFARSVVNAIALSLEIKKRRLVQEELKIQKEILHHHAHHDALTGLPNRFLFDDRLSQVIKQAQRDHTKVAVLFIDLDHFKGVNDSMGHKIGDELLVEVAHRLKAKIRQSDTLARLGGDEFTIIMSQIKNNDEVVAVTQNLLRVMNDPIELQQQSFYVTLSVGVVIYPDDGDTPEVLLKNADAAMYQAKDDGRNTYQFYTQTMTEKAFERIAMEAGFRKALAENEFVVYYQPQVDVNTGRYIGIEALVRWLHPEMGLITPDKFLPFAYDTGLVIPMDIWVMKTAMLQYVKWREHGLQPGLLALNLSIMQLQREDFIDTLMQLIDETACLPQWLEIEITESQIMKDSSVAVQTLNRIKQLGISIAIDDFGTGYSSLSHLKRLPVNKLKIDRSFVRDLPADEEDVVITRSVIALAQNMGMEVIAEGVENQQQKDFLLENSCHYIQGYLYSKVVSAEDIEQQLEKLAT